MHEPSLSADCGQCAALCCAYHAFDSSDQFAIDKPAGVPCPNLTGQGRCKIHASLAEHGFPGCANYDCLGAGQHVVQGVFGGRSWLAEPALKEPMFDVPKDSSEFSPKLAEYLDWVIAEGEVAAILGWLKRAESVTEAT